MSINGIPEIDQHLLSNVIYVREPCHNNIFKQGSLEPNYDFIKYLSASGKIPVIDFSIEHWGHGYTIDYTYQILQENFSKFVIMTHHPDDHLKQPNLVFYPYWNFVTRKRFNFLKDIDDLPRTYKASCLNQKPRPHRILNFFYLQQKPYASNCFFRINNPSNFVNDPNVQEIPEKISKWWDNYSQTLDLVPLFDAWYHARTLDKTLLAFTDTYVNIVTETNVSPRIFVTEKTWKAIACGQFFIIFGNPGTVQHLRDLGVDTYDDIIDHNYYDQEQDWTLRLEKIHEIIDKTMTLDLEKLWKQTLTRRRLNRMKFLKGDLVLKYKEILLQKIL